MIVVLKENMVLFCLILKKGFVKNFVAVPEAVWNINIDIPLDSKLLSLDNQDDRWWEQVDLTKLILASNAISRLGDGLANLPALTVLDVSVSCCVLYYEFGGDIFISLSFYVDILQKHFMLS